MAEGDTETGVGKKSAADLTSLECALLNDYQRDFPLVDRPFEEIARVQVTSDEEVLETLEGLLDAGMISRIGAVVKPHRTGWSTLAAMAVPVDRLDSVAALVSDLPEVNHNYEREHRLNLWFVVAAANKQALSLVLEHIQRHTGLEVLNLPLEEAYCIDLGFPLRW